MLRHLRKAKAQLLWMVLVLAVTAVGCPCNGIINDASPGFRWWIFSNFGAQKICPELTKTGFSLRLQDSAPAVGRFFPMQCSYTTDNDRQVVAVTFDGTGYAYVSPAKRVGFQCGGTIEFKMDFRFADSGDLYLWGSLNRITDGPRFRISSIENPVVDIAANLPPFGSIATFLGNAVVAGEIARGFTVVHNADQGNDFAIGRLPIGAKPKHRAIKDSPDDRFTFANERVEIHSGQRDYLGPFEVHENGKALYFRGQSTGPAVDVMLVDKLTGDAWRDGYQRNQPIPSPVPRAGNVLPQDGNVYWRFPMPAGVYYVVVDNSATAGNVAPPMGLLGLSDPTVMVSYAVQLGE